MDIHVDIRGFLEIHVWICYGFSEQGMGFNCASLPIEVYTQVAIYGRRDMGPISNHIGPISAPDIGAISK